MNAKELLQCAPRLSESNRAYVLFTNGDRAIIVPPGVTPPPSAVVRELRESGDATMHRVRVEHMRYALRNQAVEEAPTRVPTAAGSGVWRGVREAEGSKLPNEQCRI